MDVAELKLSRGSVHSKRIKIPSKVILLSIFFSSIKSMNEPFNELDEFFFELFNGNKIVRYFLSD